jgi:hypothetical protein
MFYHRRRRFRYLLHTVAVFAITGGGTMGWYLHHAETAAHHAHAHVTPTGVTATLHGHQVTLPVGRFGQ